MSEVIQGSKSSLYIKDPVPGIENSSDSFTHQSVQNLWDGRGAADVLIHAVRMSSPIASVVAAGSVKRLINVVAHGAQKGDSIRMNNGNADGEEIAIVSIVDANNFIIAKEVNASVGDELFILKPVTPTYNKDGSLNVSNGPTQFIKDAAVQQVTEDTVVPANNEPLPSKMFFQKDGVTYPVNKDTATPSNTAAVPVEIVGVSGQTVTINAGNIDVQLSHLGAGHDSTRIGDGTNLMGVNAALEALVHDTDSLAALADVNTELNTQTTALGDINTELGTQTTALGDINTTQTDGTQKTQIVDAAGDIVDIKLLSVQVVDTDKALVTQSVIHGRTTAGGGAFIDVKVNPSGALTVEATLAASVGTRIGTVAIDQTTPGTTNLVQLPASQIATLTPPAAITGFALETTQGTGNTRIGDLTETAPATDTASSGLNGRLQRIAQRLTSLIALFPSSIGAKAGTDSLSVIPATDAKFLTKPFTTTTTYAENLALTTVTTITAPANAVSVIIMADGDNANNIRVKQGGAAASLTSGFPLQAGRDIKFDCGTDLSVISDNAGSAGASVKVYFQWYIQA